MSWRWVPPVSSPVSVGGLTQGLMTAARASRAPFHDVRQRLAEVFGAQRVVLTDCGTSALTLALRLVGSGSTVAFPAYSCIDLITAAQGANVRIRLYDVDPRTLSPDLDSMRAAVHRGVHAVLVAPLFGYPVDFAAVQSIANDAGVPILEDAAQGAGGTLNGVRIGAMGSVSILSFARGKGTTGGSGGAILLREGPFGDAAHDLEAGLEPSTGDWPNLVKLGAQWALGRPLFYRVPSSIPAFKLGEMIYHPPHAPRAMSPAGVAVLRQALTMDDAEVRTRRSNADALAPIVEDSAMFMRVAPVRGGTPGYLRYAVVARTSGVQPAPTLGVMRSYPITLDEHAESQRVLIPAESGGTGSRELRDRLFTLPTHAWVTRQDMREIGAWLAGQRAL